MEIFFILLLACSSPNHSTPIDKNEESSYLYHFSENLLQNFPVYNYPKSFERQFFLFLLFLSLETDLNPENSKDPLSFIIEDILDPYLQLDSLEKPNSVEEILFFSHHDAWLKRIIIRTQCLVKLMSLSTLDFNLKNFYFINTKTPKTKSFATLALKGRDFLLTKNQKKIFYSKIKYLFSYKENNNFIPNIFPILVLATYNFFNIHGLQSEKIFDNFFEKYSCDHFNFYNLLHHLQECSVKSSLIFERKNSFSEEKIFNLLKIL